MMTVFQIIVGTVCFCASSLFIACVIVAGREYMKHNGK